jgi:phosphoglucomutase
MKDYGMQKAIDFRTNTSTPINLPKSNVLQFFTEDGSKVTVRPSGTEPLIKFYFGVKTDVADKDSFKKAELVLQQKITELQKSLGI